ncbi:hypothetical protein AURDEDRAFT_129877 [Auricularia subglabra TFB-10046 SS5]|nr:hypothetical protein AURDEDRAFT_129877 [Auricularia subglabra TFB-10046 SS5]
MVPQDLQTRIRAEIRQHWQRADFHTLSRYVLADRNFRGNPVLSYEQFNERFDLVENPSLRCEDGLAAVVKVDPAYIMPVDVASYAPDRISHPRMTEFLLNLIPPDSHKPAEPFIVLVNKCWKHFNSNHAFRLERELDRLLSPEMRKRSLDRSLRDTSNAVTNQTSPEALERRRGFVLSLTRTVVMLLARQDPSDDPWGLSSLLDNDERNDVIRLALEESALTGITLATSHTDEPDPKTIVETAAAIIRHISHLLRDVDYAQEGEKLFGLLARVEAKPTEGINLPWDLGEWIRNSAPSILEWYPDAGTAFQEFHEEMVAIYPMCARRSTVAAHWDRIGYPGRPGDTLSDPFLRLGAFFENAEESFSERAMQQGEISSNHSLDLGAFFDVAEASHQHPRDFVSAARAQSASLTLGAFFHMAEGFRGAGARRRRPKGFFSYRPETLGAFFHMAECCHETICKKFGLRCLEVQIGVVVVATPPGGNSLSPRSTWRLFTTLYPTLQRGLNGSLPPTMTSS